MIEDFWDWLPKAYGEVGDEPVFTKYDMEVAFAAGAETEGKRIEQAEQAEQAQPVAWISEGGDVSRSKRYMDEMGFKCNPLYTAPPKREWVGLTDEEIEDLIYLYQKIDASNSPYFYRRGFARAIEAKLRDKNI